MTPRIPSPLKTPDRGHVYSKKSPPIHPVPGMYWGPAASDTRPQLAYITQINQSPYLPILTSATTPL